MNAQRRSAWVAVALVVTGVTCLAAHTSMRRRAAGERTDSLWRLQCEITFEAEERGAVLRTYIPHDTGQFRVFHQDLHSPRLEITQGNDPRSAARFISVTAPARGEYRLDLRFDLHLLAHDALDPTYPARATTTGVDAPDAEPPPDTDFPVASNVIARVARELDEDGTSTAQRARTYFQFCRSAHHDGDNLARSDAEAIFRKRLKTLHDRTEALVALCRQAGIPVRRVTGFVIQKTRHAEPHSWLETYAGDRWIPCDLRSGMWDSPPTNYLAIRRGAAGLIERREVSEVESEFAIARIPAAPDEELSSQRGVLASIFDLTLLPLQMHDVVSIILLMPLGALVTCLFRNIIGIETSGRFTPMLLALSFIFADWHTGLVVFTTVVILGLTTRTMVEPLKLLMLPRLSIILTLVVWCLVFGVSALAYFDLTPGPHAVLLPMVILTMIVERFYVQTQEDGATVAVRRLAGTIIVGFFCYLVLRWEFVAQLLLTYPEAHLLTLAVLILIGRYTGYRLAELWRFRDMVETSN